MWCSAGGPGAAATIGCTFTWCFGFALCFGGFLWCVTVGVLDVDVLVELLVDEELLLELEPELEPVLLEPPEPVLGGGVVDDPPEPPPEPPVDPLPPGGGGGGGGALSASAGDAAASIAPVTSRMVRFLRAPMFPMPLSASPGCGLGRCTTSSVPVPAVVGNWSF
jgi:hypothetical protein